MNIAITGGPRREITAAIVASIEQLLARPTASPIAAPSAWQRAAVTGNVAPTGWPAGPGGWARAARETSSFGV